MGLQKTYPQKLGFPPPRLPPLGEVTTGGDVATRSLRQKTSPCKDVPGGVRNKGRHLGPQPPQRLGTPLAALTPRPGVGLTQTRWARALRHWERPSGRGLGAPPVSGDPNRRETAGGSAVLASFLGLRLCPHALVPGNPWRLVPLPHALRLRVMTNPIEH